VIVAVDVQYAENTARAAAVGFQLWSDERATQELVVDVDHIAPYEPGAFYKRELPCILKALEKMAPRVVVIDAYVDLDDNKPGLGRRLFDVVKVPVIGVAKTHYAGAPAIEVMRGASKSPLYVSAAGMNVEEAARAIASMHGPHRMPALLARVDALARGR
jgi:deoxyribonuclease V